MYIQIQKYSIFLIQLIGGGGGVNISSNNINPKEFLNEGSSQSMERDGLIWLI